MTMPHPPGEPVDPFPDTPPISPSFSLVFTLIFSVFIVTGIGTIVWSNSSLLPLERVNEPGRALERLTSRAMELEQALTRVSPVEQYLVRLLGGNEDALQRAIQDYQELADYSIDPMVGLYLAVLELEAGHKEKVSARIQSWKDLSPPFPLFNNFIQSAYFGTTLSPSEANHIQAQLAETVPNNWFYHRLAMHIAETSRDAEFTLWTERHFDEQVSALLRSSRFLIILEISGGVIGVICMFVLFRKTLGQPPGTLRISHAPLPPPWSGYDGVAVLIRGGAATIFLLFSLSVLNLDGQVMVLLSMFILYVPILYLTQRYLLVPHSWTIGRAFGLSIPLSRLPGLVPVMFVLLGAGLIGDWVITMAAERAHWSIHWTEWFDQNLVWGTPSDVVLTMLEYTVIAPVFEEAIFRGVIFATLRTRFSWQISALLSGLIFALVHGYGLVGLLTVFWSGVLWAWAYEKTGSLLPGIVAHAINNLLVTVTVVALFR